MELSIKEKLLSGGFWVVGGKAFSMISRLAFNAFLARILSPDNLGVYFLIFSLVNFSMLFSLLGMDRSIVRVVSESLALDQPERARTAVKYTLQIGFVSSLIVALLLISGIGQFLSEKVFGSELMSALIYFPALWVILMTLQMLILESFRGYHDIRFASLFNNLITNILLAAAFGLVFWKYGQVDIAFAVSIILAAYAVNLALSSLALLTKLWKTAQKKTDRPLISRSEVVNTSWLLYLSSFSLYFMEIGPLWLLAYFSDKNGVAIYGAMMRLVVLITSTLGIIKMVILPMIRHLYITRDFEKMERVLRTTATIAGIPSIIGLLLVIVFGKEIISLIFGEHYVLGYSTLVVLSSAHLVNVLTGTPGVLLVMASKEIYLLLFSLISAAITISISFALVGPMDYLGIAIGAGIGIILQNLFMAWYCLKILSINTFMDIREIAGITRAVKAQLAFSFGGSNRISK